MSREGPETDVIPAQAVTLVQNHEHPLYIMSKIVLAGLHALLCPADITEVS